MWRVEEIKKQQSIQRSQNSRVVALSGFAPHITTYMHSIPSNAP